MLVGIFSTDSLPDEDETDVLVIVSVELIGVPELMFSEAIEVPLDMALAEGVEVLKSPRVDVDHGIEIMELVVSVCLGAKSPSVLVVEMYKLDVAKSPVSDIWPIEEN